jgi:hypothetical protein
MFSDASEEVNKMEIPIDAISIRIGNSFDELKQCQCCKIFGIAGSSGWDIKLVDLFLFIQFIFY